MPNVSKRFSLADQLRNDLEIEATPTSGLFSEEPVPLNVFLHDKKYMNQPGLDLGEHQFNLVRHMEQIYLPSMYPYMVENFGELWTPVRYVNLLNIQWGKGAGKDFSVQMAVARIAYLLLCLENPQEYYGLSSQSDIHVLNVAMNSAQARRAFFKPLGTALKNSRWFSDKLRSEITDMASSIRLEKQIELISGHSAVENFEGLSPIAAVLDEISGFQSDTQKAAKGIVESQRTAEAIYDIVRTSAATRFPESFKVAAISYPRYLHDPIQNLCDKGNKDIEERGLENSRYYVDGPRATWEVNPRYFKYDLISIPETTTLVPDLASFVGDYEDDAVMSRAKYECRPERAVNRFMRNDSALAAALPKHDEDWLEPLVISYYWGIDEEGAKAEGSWELANRPGWQVSYQFNNMIPMEGAIYALHADLAVSGDRAGISMCHVKNWERREFERGGKEIMNPDFQNDDRPIVKVDFVTYYEADLEAKTDDNELQPREIQIRWFRNLVRELKRRGFTIGFVTFDNFQSTDSIQILEMWGIESDKLSVDRTNIPYTTLRDIIYDGRLEGYYNELLLQEFEGLNQLSTGKIDHPPGGSKDMADALCGAVTNAITMGGDEGEEPEAVNLAYGQGYEVNGNLGASQSAWGNLNWTTPAELKSAFGRV